MSWNILESPINAYLIFEIVIHVLDAIIDYTMPVRAQNLSSLSYCMLNREPRKNFCLPLACKGMSHISMWSLKNN